MFEKLNCKRFLKHLYWLQGIPSCGLLRCQIFMQMDNSQHFTANKETTHKKCTNRFHKFPSFSTSIHLQNWKYFAVKQAFCLAGGQQLKLKDCKRVFDVSKEPQHLGVRHFQPSIVLFLTSLLIKTACLRLLKLWACYLVPELFDWLSVSKKGLIWERKT